MIPNPDDLSVRKPALHHMDTMALFQNGKLGFTRDLAQN
jgi:hypothetical protein